MLIRVNREWVIFLLLSGLVGIVFIQTIDYEFVMWDDNVYVTNNPLVLEGLNGEKVKECFTRPVQLHYAPVAMVSHMLDVEIFGLKAGGHHLTNVVIHLLNCMLLYYVLQLMTGAFWPCVFVASLFAIHPLHVENVVWVSLRKDVLSFFFFLLSLLSYIRYVKDKQIRWYGLCIFFYVFGMLSKSIVVTLPLVFLLLDYWPLERLTKQTQQCKFMDHLRSKKQGGYLGRAQHDIILEKISLLVLSVGIIYVTHHAMGNLERTQDSVGTVPFHLRLGNGFASYAWYVVKTIYPSRLAAHYVHPYLPEGVPWSGMQLGGAVILLATVFFLILAVLKRRYLIVGWLWFLLTLSPVIGIIQFSKASGRADRYMYIPMIGLLIMVAWGGKEVLHRLKEEGDILLQCLIIGVSVICVVGYTVQARLLASYWKDSETFFSYQLSVVPRDPYFNTNMGVLCAKRGEYKQAILHCSKAVAIRPETWQAHMVLFQIYRSLGQWEEAAYHRKEGYKWKPR